MNDVIAAVILIYIIVMMIVVYAMVCGNNNFHRNGFFGHVYRFITITIPSKLKNLMKRIFPDSDNNAESDDDTCIGPHGVCKYFVISFFFAIYVFFVTVYFLKVYPSLNLIYPEKSESFIKFQKILSFFVLPWPCVLVILFQFMDPGEIRNDNVESYLKIYPYDRQIYFPHLCPTLNIPVVPRSRYCRYTNKRISCYDHYCPWILMPVGERTHRFFYLFLFTCMFASSFYAYNHYLYLDTAINSAELRWRKGKLSNFIIISEFFTKYEQLALTSFCLLIAVAGVLFFFILQQTYFISNNILQIEQEKYDDLTEKRRKNGIDTPVINFYDKGFIMNWKEFLFPPKVALHEPMMYRIKKKAKDT